MSKISNCCGAEDGMARYDGPSWSDIGICPDCRDHCEFEEEDDDIYNCPNGTNKVEIGHGDFVMLCDDCFKAYNEGKEVKGHAKPNDKLPS